jgi:sec1 family domain-containing protein 1
MASSSSPSLQQLQHQHQQSPAVSLRTLQRTALIRLLNRNTQEEQENSPPNDLLLPDVAGSEPVWKFLVFDKLGQDVISSVLRVSDLREAGITVHMQLKADRLQMEDVPASNIASYSASDFKSTSSSRPPKISIS